MRIKKQNELKMSLKGKMIIAVKHLWSNNLRRLEKYQQLNTPTQKKKKANVNLAGLVDEKHFLST